MRRRGLDGAGVRKPPKDETAGRIWRCRVGPDLWGFEGRGRVARVVAGAVVVETEGFGRRRRVWSRLDVTELGRMTALRGGARTVGRQRPPAPAISHSRRGSGLQGGEWGDRVHEVSVLIRLGDGGRAGPTPSKVSMMIMRPPQHGIAQARVFRPRGRRRRPLAWRAVGGRARRFGRARRWRTGRSGGCGGSRSAARA